MNAKYRSLKYNIEKLYDSGQYQLVVEVGAQALEEYPDDMEVLCRVAYALSMPEIGRITEAITLLEGAIDSNPSTPELFEAIATCHMMIGEERVAYRKIIRAIELDPERPELYSLMATIVSTGTTNRDDLSEAIVALKKAIQLDTDNWRLHHSLGILLWKSENPKAAKTMLQQALTTIPQEEERTTRQIKRWISSIDDNKTFWDANKVD